jgi:DNA-binding transcriptional LysR family regulator
MIDFKTLETFMWVANLRSFRGAAEKLHTTQPAISMRIAQLEDDLKVRLIERDRRMVAMTHKGQELLGYAERLMRLRAEMIEAVGDRVNSAYPGLELEIEVDISPNLRDRLVAKDLNLALLLGPISNPNVSSRPLCTFPLAFVASDKIKLPNKMTTLETIAKFPIVTFSRNTQPYIAVRDLFERAGLRATIHASASLATVVRMALDGLGIAVIPPAILGNVATPGRLRTIKSKVSLPKLNFVVSWPSAPDSHAAQKVAEIAIQAAKAAKA